MKYLLTFHDSGADEDDATLEQARFLELKARMLKEEKTGVHQAWERFHQELMMDAQGTLCQERGWKRE